MPATISFTYPGAEQLYAFPESQAPSFANWSNTSFRKLVTVVNGYATVEVDTETYGDRWRIFETSTQPTSWDNWKYKANFAVDSPTVIVYPLAAGDTPRVASSTITVYKGEETTASVTVQGDVDLTALTLRFIIQKTGGTDVVVVEDGSIDRTATTFTVTIPESVSASPNQFTWSLRIITGNVLLAKGLLVVEEAASVDES